MGLNLETREDSPGNGLANLLVVLEHMDDSERTGRDNIASWSARVVASATNLREKRQQWSSTSGGD